MGILPAAGADRELVQLTKFIPNKESEKQIRTCNLIDWGKNPTSPRAQTRDDRFGQKSWLRKFGIGFLSQLLWPNLSSRVWARGEVGFLPQPI